jgi:hypothetical protein
MGVETEIYLSNLVLKKTAGILPLQVQKSVRHHEALLSLMPLPERMFHQIKRSAE